MMELDQELRETILKAAGAYFTRTLPFRKSMKLTTTFSVIVDCDRQYHYIATDEINREDALAYDTADSASATEVQIETTLSDIEEALEDNQQDVEEKEEKEYMDDVYTPTNNISESENNQSMTEPIKPTRLKTRSRKLSTCPICTEHCKDSTELSEHITSKHKKQFDNFKCMICQKVYLKIENFSKHWRQSHKEWGNEEPVSPKQDNSRSKKAKKKNNTVRKENRKPKHKRKKIKPGKIDETTDGLESNNTDLSEKEIDDKLDEKKVKSIKIKIPKYTDSNVDVKDDKFVSSIYCSICGKKYLSQKALDKHITVSHHQDTVKYTCDVCGKTFNRKETLYHHRRGIHSKEKVFKCTEPDCNATFNFNHSLKLHILKHTGVRPYECSVCKKTYLTAHHLKVHEKGTHTMKKEYTCKICGKGFSYATSLRVHEATHSNTKRHSCDKCEKTFVNAQALKYHFLSKHGEPGNFKCDTCDKIYNSEFLLKAHQRRHTKDNNRFMCDICGRQFMYKSALEMHKSIHKDEKTFSCKVCGKSFKTYPTLYSHMFVHKEDSPFECETCGKSFKTKERLKAHARRHSGLKPFECKLCRHCFPDKGGLSKHMKTVHCPVKKFICNICGKSTTRADNLRVHMKVHSKGEVYPTMTVEQQPKVTEDDLPSTVPLVIDENNSSFLPAKKQRKPRAAGKSHVIPLIAQQDSDTSISRTHSIHQQNMPHFSSIDSNHVTNILQSAPADFHHNTTASPVNGIPSHIANENLVVIETDEVDRGENSPSSIPQIPSTISQGAISVTPMQPVSYMYPWSYIYTSGSQPGGPAHGFYQQ